MHISSDMKGKLNDSTKRYLKQQLDWKLDQTLQQNQWIVKRGKQMDWWAGNSGIWFSMGWMVAFVAGYTVGLGKRM